MSNFDINTGEVFENVYIPGKRPNNPRLDSRGREVCSPISLVRTLELKPITLADRIRRYTQVSSLRDDLLAEEVDESDDDLNFDMLDHDDALPMSKHERRYTELVARGKKAAHERAEAEKAEKIAAEKAEKEAFRQRVLAIRDLASQPTLPTDSNTD